MLGSEFAGVSVKREFRSLYDLRSNLVHGNSSRLTSGNALRELHIATEFANGVIAWAMSLFTALVQRLPTSNSQLPSRENVLDLLDLSVDQRVQLRRLMSALPETSSNLLDSSN